MAIDFFVMPFSRYVAGEPFGGADAPQRREAIMPMILDDLRALPTPFTRDEGSAAASPGSTASIRRPARRGEPSTRAPIVFRVPHARERDHATPDGRGLPSLVVRRDVSDGVPFERVVGSIEVALCELAAGKWSERTLPACETLQAALEDARALELPMFVDV